MQYYDRSDSFEGVDVKLMLKLLIIVVLLAEAAKAKL